MINKRIFIMGIVSLILYIVALATDTVIIAYAIPFIYFLGVNA